MHTLVSAAAVLAAAPHSALPGAIDVRATVGNPTTAPPGIFLKLFIFGGLSFVVFCAWFVLRGYRNSGDGDDK